MRAQVRISGKQLGELALSNYCPRCFWLKLQMGNRLPFGLFPGIFSTLDAFTKSIVSRWFDRHRCPPPWLTQLGDFVSYIEPPHFSKFNFVDQDQQILLTGAPDGIFVARDGSLMILDYKTAKFSDRQDALYPLYEAQLNAYRVIAEHCGLRPVAHLALVYFEPVTEPVGGISNRCHRLGFRLDFSAHPLKVPCLPGLVDRLLAQGRAFAEMRRPPAPSGQCKNCGLLERIIGLTRPGARRRHGDAAGT